MCPAACRLAGNMVSMGFGGGIIDITKADLVPGGIPGGYTSGLAAFMTWRLTYLTKQLSFTNMVLIPMYWFKAVIFGRDISRF